MFGGLGRDVHFAAVSRSPAVGTGVAVLSTTRLIIHHLLIELLDCLGLGSSATTRLALLRLGLLFALLDSSLTATSLASTGGRLWLRSAVGERLGDLGLGLGLDGGGVDNGLNLVAS